jgi:nitrous oxide reductase
MLSAATVLCDVVIAVHAVRVRGVLFLTVRLHHQHFSIREGKLEGELIFLGDGAPRHVPLCVTREVGDMEKRAERAKQQA